MCDLVKSVDNGDNTLTWIDKCLMKIDKFAYQSYFEKLTIGNEDECEWTEYRRLPKVII